MILDACVSFKLLPSNLLHGVCLFRIGGIVIFYIIVFGDMQRWEINSLFQMANRKYVETKV